MHTCIHTSHDVAERSVSAECVYETGMLCFYRLVVAGLVVGEVQATCNVNLQVGIMTGCHSHFWVARQACLEAL